MLTWLGVGDGCGQTVNIGDHKSPAAYRNEMPLITFSGGSGTVEVERGQPVYFPKYCIIEYIPSLGTFPGTGVINVIERGHYRRFEINDWKHEPMIFKIICVRVEPKYCRIK